MSESGPPVRRSSLRPAPADYKPSARDPSKMRPMAVVRAGDAEPNQLDAELASDVHTEKLPESRRAHLELSEEYTSQTSGDRITPLSIPPPPGIPSDLLSSALGQRSTQGGIAGTAGKAPEQPSSSLAGAAITEEPVASNRRKYGSIAVTLTFVAAVAAVLGILHGRERVAHRVPAAPIGNTMGPSPTLDKAVVNAQTPSVTHAVNDAPAAAPIASIATKSAISNEPPPANNTTRVTLELMPIDAKVFVRGHEIPGPPFAFDVPNGRKLAIEVKRPGFATAKVVIDGKKPLVHFGMLRDTHR